MSFYKKYIVLNLGDYEAFGGFDFYITVFVAALTVATCIDVFIFNTRKNTMIDIVKQLYRHGATSEDNARTLKELRVKSTFISRSLLSEGTRLSRVVARVGARTLTYEEYVAEEKRVKLEKKKKKLSRSKKDRAAESNKINFETAKFYILSERDCEAKDIFSKSKTSLWQNILICVLLICLAAIVTLLMPEILSLLNSLLK